MAPPPEASPAHPRRRFHVQGAHLVPRRTGYWDMTHFRDWPDVIHRGDEGVRRFLDEWLEVWDDYEVGLDEILAAPDGRIVTLAWQRGTGRRSGLPMEMEWAQISTVRDGKILRIETTIAVRRL